MYTLAVNKKTGIIIVVVIGLILIGLLASMAMKKPGQPQESVSNGASMQTTENGVSETSGSIKSLLGAGKNVTCEVTYPDGKNSGTVYVADKKFRGDFTMTDPSGKTIENHMIQDGNYVYFWTGSEGTKMKMDVLATPSPQATTNQSADLDKQASMKCSPWGVDQSKLAVPADVKFTDMSAMMQNVKGMTTETNGSGASPCDSITDPQAKASCESAMSGQ